MSRFIISFLAAMWDAYLRAAKIRFEVLKNVNFFELELF